MNTFTIIGLIFDIIGVLMLFQYGLPSRLETSSESICIEESTDDELKREKKNRRIKILAFIGLSFIFLGFVFQLLGAIY
jgi:uncharacterized protein YqhQ